MVWSYFFFLLWFIYLIASSILLFTRGFLLTRESLELNSTCLMYSEIPCTFTDALRSDSNTNNGLEHSLCLDKLENILSNIGSAANFCLPSRARVVLIIIDALRYDFTVYDPNNKNPLPFQNKLPIIQETLQMSPESSRLYKFIADPPTTTMQRLKALTTGSLPTFVDAGSNFASYEITEDNIIDQLVRNNLSVVFMGDDTWDGLYPKRFKRSYPFPSFNVHDLDTVDRGVLKNLYPELQTNDWNLLIGHFLGVDHAGHRYGPNHNEMKRKLVEMNTMIRSVMDKMHDDMILYVLGDHGMTVTGDHGGETENEISSALYVYSKLPLASSQNSTVTKQVNIVPTLATVLGIPIPYSNLGSILHDALPELNHSNTIPQWKFSLYSTWSNAEQVVEYLRQYSKDSDIFESDRLKRIYEKFNILKAKVYTVDHETLVSFQLIVTEYIEDIRKMCEEVWIQFDSFSITRGLLLLFLSLFFVFILTDGVPARYLRELFFSSFLMCSYVASFIAVLVSFTLYYFEVINNLLSSIFFGTGVVSQFMMAMLIVQNWDTISLNWHSKSKKNKLVSCISRSVLAFCLLSLFSNSYIEEEATVLLFLLSTVSLVGIINVCKNMPKEKNSSKSAKVKFILFSIIVAALLRISVSFWKCREEQGSCFSGNFINVGKESTKSVWALALASLILFVTITKTWLKNCGSLNGYSFPVTLAKYAPTVMVVFTAGYWIFHRLPVDTRTSTRVWKVDHLVWMVYFTSITSILTTSVHPLLVFIVPRKSNITVPNDANVIPNLFKKVKGLMEEKEKISNEIPVIYGLGTVFSTTYIAIGIYLAIMFSLILGEAQAPSALIMFMTAMFMLIVISTLRIEKATSIDDLFEMPNSSILIWVVLAHYFFFGTGHQPAWSNIDWNAAFVGTSGIFSSNYVQGALVILNTFCPYILMGFFLPMLAIAPFTLFVMTPSVLRRNKELHKDVMNQGELLLFERSENMFTTVLVVCCKYIACHGIRVFASMLAATIHCRHLMAWKIFAPKFIFEAIGMLVTLISVLFGYLVLVRINCQVEKLITKLNKKDS